MIKCIIADGPTNPSPPACIFIYFRPVIPPVHQEGSDWMSLQILHSHWLSPKIELGDWVAV